MRHTLRISRKKFHYIYYTDTNFIILKYDKKYQTGDILILREVNNDKLTGNFIKRVIRFIFSDEGLKPDYYLFVF